MASRAVIKSKLAPPPMPERLVGRARLDDLLTGLIEEHPIIRVCATAGAGKTTAVCQAAARGMRAVAWLTLDDTDTAPGRLLTYVQAALADVLSDDDHEGSVATQALAAGIAHPEAAGLLIDAVRGPVLLVIDEVERLAASRPALEVLEALARHMPAEMRLVLISRRDVPIDLGSRSLAAAVGEDDLAFTEPEAAAALARAGEPSLDAEAAVRATGGWVTGVLFEAWRSKDHVIGHGGERDPLHGYLATQILEQLTQADREFLVSTAVLDRVDAERAQRLGLTDASARLAALRAAHLPVSWDESGATLRAHPRLREFLLESLEQRSEEAVAELRLAHARLLADELLHEDAVEEFLHAGHPREARASMELAIGPVLERLDFAVAERWLRSISGHAESSALWVPAAELMLAMGQDQYSRAAALGDELAARGLRDELLRSYNRTAGLLAWCYFHVGRVQDAVAVLDVGVGTPEVELARHLLTLVDRDTRDLELPRPSGGPLDGLLFRLRYAHGHLRELHEPPDSRFAAAMSAAWRVASHRARGELDEARELLEVARRGPGDSGLLDLVGTEVAADLGNVEEAWQTLARAREQIRRSGSTFLLLLSFVTEAKLELRLNHDPQRAEAVLDALGRHPNGRTYRFISEQADTWHGLILLLRQADADAAARLADAVTSMVAGDRILELPAGAVYLAEACWRLGDEDGADRAADVALAASQRQGAEYGLLQALGDFPTVAARRIDAEAGRHSPWHAIARRMVAEGRGSGFRAGATVELHDLGPSLVVVDGHEHRPRIKKSYELLAFLLARPEQRAARLEVLDALFDGRVDDSARSYLRQAVRELRAIAPDMLEVDDLCLAVSDTAVVSAESARAEALLREAERLHGAERLDRTRCALRALEAGEYLPGSSSPWVEVRREELRGLVAEARLDAAELAFAHGQFADADGLLRALLDEDPWRESAWRLRIRLAHALGDDDAVLDAYQRCRSALRSLDVEPSAATRALLAELRR